MQILYKIIFLLSISFVDIFSSIIVTSTPVEVVKVDSNIDDFTIEVKINNISDIKLADEIKIVIPDNIPEIANVDLDDGKLYVSWSFQDKNSNSYSNAPGLKIIAYKHEIDIKIISLIRTFISSDVYANTASLSNGDKIIFKFSSALDNINKATALYQDNSVIKVSTNSQTLKLINQTSTIKTPSVDLKITNPAVKFDRNGLGASSNPVVSFFFKGGLKKNSRIEVEFPKGFDISSLNGADGYILINKKYSVQKVMVDNQKVSFLINDDIKEDNIDIYFMSYRVKNITDTKVQPFAVRIYKETINTSTSFNDISPLSNEIYYDDLDNDAKYSREDKIYISFSQPVYIYSITSSSIYLSESDKSKSFGSYFNINAIDPILGYSSFFEIVLGVDVNLTQGTSFYVKKSSLISKTGSNAISDAHFTVPSIFNAKLKEGKKTIIQTHSKLFAKNDIDMLYKPLNTDLIDRAPYQDLVFHDNDLDEKYSNKDTFVLKFSRPIYSSLFANMDNIVSISRKINFGLGATLKRKDKGDSLYADTYLLTLGFNTDIKAGDLLAFKMSSIVAEDGAIPAYDVTFSQIPYLIKPTTKDKIVKFEDRDNNEIYSAGDRIILEFNIAIKPFVISDLFLKSNKILHASYMIASKTKNGFSKKIIIGLGDKTQLQAGDSIEILKSSIISENNIRAGLHGNLEFLVPSMKKPKIKTISFNHMTNSLLVELSNKVKMQKKEKLLDEIYLYFDKVKRNLSYMGDSIISTVFKDDSIYLAFSDTFMKTLKSTKMKISFSKDLFKFEQSQRSNDELNATFYATFSINNLIANEWNLVSLPNTSSSTTIKDIKNTNNIDNIYVFDIKSHKWVSSEDTIINAGDAIWIHPLKTKVDKIQSIMTNLIYEDKTTILNKMLNMPLDRAYYLGNSAISCNRESILTMKDITKIAPKDIKFSLLTYNNDLKNYDENVDYVEACKGFMVIKQRATKKETNSTKISNIKQINIPKNIRDKK